MDVLEPGIDEIFMRLHSIASSKVDDSSLNLLTGQYKLDSGLAKLALSMLYEECVWKGPWIKFFIVGQEGVSYFAVIDTKPILGYLNLPVNPDIEKAAFNNTDLTIPITQEGIEILLKHSIVIRITPSGRMSNESVRDLAAQTVQPSEN